MSKLAPAETVNVDRRWVLGTTVFFPAIAGISVQTANAQTTSPTRNASAGRLQKINAGLLSIGYNDEGPESGPVVILLHGWPYDIHAYSEVCPILQENGYRVIVPYLRGYGSTRFLSPDTLRNGQQAALAGDVLALMDSLKIPSAIIAGYDWGARTANIVAALHPDRCTAMVSVSGYLIGSQSANRLPLPPQAEQSWWYQFYFATERGRAGYRDNTREFARLIWQTASPQWRFDEATFERSATAFDNPDHVQIVIHNYRWRLGLAEGEQQYEGMEQALAAAPSISVPTITLEGDSNGAPHPDPRSYAKKFSGPYEHRTIRGGIGHNLPQEAPMAFAQAIIDVSGMQSR